MYQIPKLDLNPVEAKKLIESGPSSNNEAYNSIKSGRHTNRALKGMDDWILEDLSNE